MKNKEKLAELVGILLGDGSLSLRAQNTSSINRMKISFNARDDKEYIHYVNKLLFELFKMKPIVKKRPNENTADLFIFKKRIIEFLVEEIGLKLSPKWKRAIIPSTFLEKNLDLYVLRGYFDTDGSLVVTNNNGIIYPRLEMKICPSPMQTQFVNILNKYGFRFGVYDIGKGKVRVQMNGKEQLRKWKELVGFGNKKHYLKSRIFNC